VPIEISNLVPFSLVQTHNVRECGQIFCGGRKHPNKDRLSRLCLDLRYIEPIIEQRGCCDQADLLRRSLGCTRPRPPLRRAKDAAR
jgi:hypothetical protein